MKRQAKLKPLADQLTVLSQFVCQSFELGLSFHRGRWGYLDCGWTGSEKQKVVKDYNCFVQKSQSTRSQDIIIGIHEKTSHAQRFDEQIDSIESERFNTVNLSAKALSLDCLYMEADGDILTAGGLDLEKK